MGKKRLTLEFVRSSFEKEGYRLLIDEYINCDQLLWYICDKGHKHRINWSNWKKGVRCPYCEGQGKPDIDVIRKGFESAGYELLSQNYVKDSHKLTYKCPIGHIHSMRWGNFRHGKRCPTCFLIDNILNKTGDKCYNWQGGITKHPYCDVWRDKEYKESIKERDGYKCKNPDCKQDGNKLVIHHIDYDKKNCHPSNLITLCNSCNIRANSKRELHSKIYKNIIESMEV
jgi:hypothetical protein